MSATLMIALARGEKNKVNRSIAAGLLLALPYPVAAMAAPPTQLLNKTIVSSFTVTVPAIEEDGRQVVAKRTADRRIYISSMGRIFEKRAQSGRQIRKESELDPTNTKLQFVGSKLRAFIPRASG